MSYTPNTWATGDTITAAKLNNMEQGIANAGGGPLIVNMAQIPNDEFQNISFDKTWQEIHDALISRGVTILRHGTGEGYDMYTVNNPQFVTYDASLDYPYLVTAADEEYTAATASDYPRTRYVD